MSPALERVLRLAALSLAANYPGGILTAKPLASLEEIASVLRCVLPIYRDETSITSTSVAAWLEVYEAALVSEGGGS